MAFWPAAHIKAAQTGRTHGLIRSITAADGKTVCAASTAAEARQRLREYRENEPHYAHRIKRRRTRPRCMYNHEHNGRDCMYHD